MVDFGAIAGVVFLASTLSAFCSAFGTEAIFGSNGRTVSGGLDIAGAGRTELRCVGIEGRLATSITGRDGFGCII